MTVLDGFLFQTYSIMYCIYMYHLLVDWKIKELICDNEIMSYYM
jgi:hypothetical protein